jgi:hypothetical protein
MRSRSPATLAVDKCLEADIPSVRLGSIARPAFRDPDLHEVRRHPPRRGASTLAALSQVAPETRRSGTGPISVIQSVRAR